MLAALLLFVSWAGGLALPSAGQPSEGDAWPSVSAGAERGLSPGVRALMQETDAGAVPAHFIGPDTYGASPQNWNVAQDSSGVLYIANTDGVLIYDGRSWQTVPVANRSVVRSVAVDEAGRVFVGSQRDIGVLRRDSLGHYRYASLLTNVPEADRTFTDVWHTDVTSEGVYFQAKRRLMRWNPERQQMRVWSRDTPFHVATAVRDTLFVSVDQKNLMYVRGDSLHAAEDGSFFADQAVRFILPHGDDGLLVGTNRGLFARRGGTYQRVPTEADPLLEDAWVYTAETGPGGLIGFTTINRGVFVISPTGQLLRHWTPQDSPVLDLFVDREGGWWALLDGGLVRYALDAPYTQLDADLGLSGSVQAITRHRGTLYVATSQGTHRLVPGTSEPASLEAITPADQSWTLLSTDEALLIGQRGGLFRYRPQNAPTEGLAQVFEIDHVYDLLRSRHDASRVYAATSRGVNVLTYDGADWQVAPPLAGVNTEARALAEAEDGTLWVGTTFDGVYRVRFLTADSVSVDHYSTEHGLPEGSIDPLPWKGEIVFGTAADILRFVPGSPPAFERVSSIESPPATSTGSSSPGVEYIVTGRDGDAWGFLEEGPAHWVHRGSRWQWAPGAVHRLRDRSIGTLYVEDEGATVWMGGQKALLRYVPERRSSSSPQAQIHRATTQATDSLLRITSAPPRIPHAERGLRIEYGAPSLVRPAEVEYQHRIDGHVPEWSEWTRQTRHTVVGLDADTYTFAVRARTVYGDTTQAARYTFTMLPPWYQTWGAYAAYVLLAVGLVGGVVQWRTRRLRQQQRHLQAMVDARTEEIQEKNVQLAEKNDQLADQAEKLRTLDEAKSRFFANISHEFRTPLTLIRGPLQTLQTRLQNGTLGTSDAASLAIAERNTGRLQRLINQILRLAQLDAGTYALHARPLDLCAEVDRIVEAFAPLAQRRDVGLHVHCSAEHNGESRRPIYVDPEALQYVLDNLLSNALKFTPSGGRVDVTVRETDDAASCAVADTGVGIAEDKQATIFDRFAQGDDTTTRSAEGAGIGLAFARDLVDLHGGSITVDSTLGEGATFTVRFRRGADHLAPDQLDGPRSEAETDDPAPDVSLPDSPIEPVTPKPSESTATWPDTTEVGGDTFGTPPPEKRVLVVDDNADLRRYIRSILEPSFEVVEAGNGAEGFTTARDLLPDVILADVMMPEVDGVAMTQRLRKTPETAAIPIVMVTARASEHDELEGLREGATDYVTKPFSAAVLEQRIRGILSMQERLRRRLEQEAGADATDPSEHKTPSGDESASDDTLPPSVSPTLSNFERRARAIIERHLSDPTFSVADLNDHFPISRPTLYRRFDDVFGTPPSALITEMRLERAATLLEEEAGTVSEIAYAVGFSRMSSFSRAFRNHMGLTPTEYAEQTA